MRITVIRGIIVLTTCTAIGYTQSITNFMFIPPADVYSCVNEQIVRTNEVCLGVDETGTWETYIRYDLTASSLITTRCTIVVAVVKLCYKMPTRTNGTSTIDVYDYTYGTEHTAVAHRNDKNSSERKVYEVTFDNNPGGAVMVVLPGSLIQAWRTSTSARGVVLLKLRPPPSGDEPGWMVTFKGASNSYWRFQPYLLVLYVTGAQASTNINTCVKPQDTL